MIQDPYQFAKACKLMHEPDVKEPPKVDEEPAQEQVQSIAQS